MNKAIVCLVILFSLLCFEIQSQIISDSTIIEGKVRSFHFLAPTKKKSKGSLLFILHGSGGDGRAIRSFGKKSVTQSIEELAAKENVMIVYPDGYMRYWNECRKTAQSLANKENINEEAFFNYMINFFKDSYSIDAKKVYVIGTSGGGHMAYKLTITIPEKISGICALIANLPDDTNMDCIEKKVAKPVMIVNGTDDTINPYLGGEVITGKVSLGFVRSTDKSFQYWSELAGYNGSPKHTKLKDKIADNKTIDQYTFRKRGRPEVTLYKVNGGKHDYPGDIDVYLEAWAFFKRIKK